MAVEVHQTQIAHDEQPVAWHHFNSYVPRTPALYTCGQSAFGMAAAVPAAVPVPAQTPYMLACFSNVCLLMAVVVQRETTPHDAWRMPFAVGMPALTGLLNSQVPTAWRCLLQTM